VAHNASDVNCARASSCIEGVCLFQEFLPGKYYWRLVLIIRKLVFVVISLLFSRNSMFQVSPCDACCVL
jgi:hypothetical protein